MGKKRGNGDFDYPGGRTGLETSAYLCGIPPKTSLKPQRHFFDEEIYILLYLIPLFPVLNTPPLVANKSQLDIRFDHHLFASGLYPLG